VEIFRRSAEAIVKVTAKVGGRKGLQKVVSENTGPGSLQ
jgi:hypothetical protein